MDEEIVIKLPEEVIELAKSNPNYYPMFHFGKIWRAISNSTSLPKGHGRLIDISEYEDNYFNTAIQYDDGDRTREKYTFAIPTIIEADKGEEK